MENLKCLLGASKLETISVTFNSLYGGGRNSYLTFGFFNWTFGIFNSQIEIGIFFLDYGQETPHVQCCRSCQKDHASLRVWYDLSVALHQDYTVCSRAASWLPLRCSTGAVKAAIASLYFLKLRAHTHTHTHTHTHIHLVLLAHPVWDQFCVFTSCSTLKACLLFHADWFRLDATALSTR